MSVAAGAALLGGLVALPAWLLVTGRRLRHKGRRVRGAFWGGVAGYLLGDALFLALALRPPLVWPPEGSAWTLPAALIVPAVAGIALGAAVGRRPPERRR